MRKLTVVFTLAVLAMPLIATAQEDVIAQYANLDQLGHVIDAFVAGDELEGIIFDAADEASDVIVRQFQITTNLVSGPTRGKADIEFVPVGFSEGSTTKLDNLEEQFDGTIGEFDGIIPPLAPESRVDDEIDVSALFEGWTAYGDRGLIEGPIIINPSVQTIWGLELSNHGSCSDRRYFGRSWVSEGVGNAPDPLFTAEGLADSYNDDSHQALAGTGGRLIEFFCTPQGSIAWAQRMKDDGRVRSFGPTGVIALVKDQFVVFFNRVDELDGRLDQIFYASPPDGGPVVVSEVESEDLLLVPNPYDVYPTRISILVGTNENAKHQDGARQLLYDGTEASTLKIQTGGGCTLVDTEFFAGDDFRKAAESSGFGRNRSSSIAFGSHDDLIRILVQAFNEKLEIDTKTGDVEFETSTCTGTGSALVNGEPLGDGGTPETDDSEDGSGESDDDSSTEAGGDDTTTTEEEGGDIPWGPIGIALALVAAVTAYTVNRNRTRKDCKPEEEALDAATHAASLAHKHASEKETAVAAAINGDASKESIAKARTEADRAHAAAEVAMDTFRQARAAYQACKGAAATGDEIDPSGLGVGTTRTRGDIPEPKPDPKPENGGTPMPPELPAVLTEPEDTDQNNCEAKWILDDSLSQEFEILAGNVILSPTKMKDFNELMGRNSGLDPDDFDDLTEDLEGVEINDSIEWGWNVPGEIKDALEDYGGGVRIKLQVQVRTVTTQCERLWECDANGNLYDSGETRRAADIQGSVRLVRAGQSSASTTRYEIVRQFQTMRAKLESLEEQRETLDDVECD